MKNTRLNRLNKLLIANRGEIACRVIGTAKQLGITTVAIYSPIDSQARHVSMADEAWAVSSNELDKSYLDIHQIIDIAKKSGSDAIHPGYGFLSENSQFATACEVAGIIFIGPSAETISLMAEKDTAKQLMQKNGVPTIPGFTIDNSTNIAEEATHSGFPLLIKAVSGGGGKGMRLAHNLQELHNQIEQAQTEAKRAFGDERVICERYLTDARHIEVQIFFDQQGNGVYLFERDCSLQRRYQKVIEFAPAQISSNLRQKMGEIAVAAGKAVQYTGAGTVEFLVANDNSEAFYFLEMNTRLQVEHPVTEMIVDEDLVSWQLQIATGKPLPKQQSELSILAHAIELRLYAENPQKDFAPSSGTITYLSLPQNCRIDHAMRKGVAVANLYDPMLGKLIVSADSYSACINKAIRSLNHCFIDGIHTNISFLKAILESQPVQNNQINIKTLESMEINIPADYSKALICCALLLIWQQEDYSQWRLWDTDTHTIRQTFYDENHSCLRTLSISQQSSNNTGNNTYSMTSDDENTHQATLYQCSRLDENSWSMDWLYNNIQSTAHIQKSHLGYQVLLSGQSYQFRQPVASDFVQHAGNATENTGQILAPMPGIIQSVAVQVDEQVTENQTVVVLEAMKMLTYLVVPVAAQITKIHVTVQQNVSEGQLLAEWQPLADS